MADLPRAEARHRMAKGRRRYAADRSPMLLPGGCALGAALALALAVLLAARGSCMCCDCEGEEERERDRSRESYALIGVS